MASSDLKAIMDYPDIDFKEGYTLERLESEMIAWYQEKYLELTGKSITLARADPRRIILQAGAYYIYQGYALADRAAKYGLLKYAAGDWLENLGALKGVSRLPAKAATVTLRFSLSVARASVTAIPAGTGATAGDRVYFRTEEYAEIPAGQLHVDVEAVCSTAGLGGNVYTAGEITTLENPVAFVDSVSNITASSGGRDIESDSDLRERIYLAPESYTSGGSAAAYKYHVLEYDSTVDDVYIYSPEPNVVHVSVILDGGVLPDSEYLAGLTEYLSQDHIKMLTDTIEVAAPERSDYYIVATYYIASSDAANAATIQAKVSQAVTDYVEWQDGKIGRDINPSELVRRVMEAGAKRVEVTNPTYRAVQDGYVAHLAARAMTYGGLEDG